MHVYIIKPCQCLLKGEVFLGVCDGQQNLGIPECGGDLGWLMVEHVHFNVENETWKPPSTGFMRGVI